MMRVRSFGLCVLLVGALYVLVSSSSAAPAAAGAPLPATPPSFVYIPWVFSLTVAKPVIPAVLATGQAHPTYITVDSERVYWFNCGTSSNDGTIMAFSKSAGSSTTLVSGVGCPRYAQADGDYIYWIVQDYSSPTYSYTLFRVSKNGGQPVELARRAGECYSLGLDDRYIYWDDNMQVLRLPKTGGGTPQPAPIPALVFDGAEAYWLNDNKDVMQSAKDGSSAVVLVSGSDIAKIGGAPPGFHTSHTVTGIYPIGKDVYLTVFVNMHAGMIGCSDMATFLLKIPKAGGPFTVLATVMDDSVGLVSEPFVYWTGYYCTGLIKGSLDSSAKLELDQSNTYRKLADDMDYVYWTDYNLGTVNAISK